ncbi:MAG: MFS transporter, partial [Candidatus Binataceae bacterium]
ARGRWLEVAQLAGSVFGMAREAMRPPLMRLFTLAFMLTFVLAALEATFALMVAQVYGYGAFGVGALLGFAGLVQAITQGYLLGKLVPRFGELKLLRAGALALAIGFAPLGSIRSHAVLLVLLALVAAGYGLSSPAVASLLSRRSERHAQGAVLGINQSALSMARIFGPLFGAAAYAALGPAAPYVGGAMVALVALMLTRGIDSVSA